MPRAQVPDYYEIVKEPIDLKMILDRIDAGDYYITLEARSRRVQRFARAVLCVLTRVVSADLRCGLSAAVQQLPPLQRARHAVLQVR